MFALFPSQGPFAYSNFFIRIFRQSCDKPASGKGGIRDARGLGIGCLREPTFRPQGLQSKKPETAISGIFAYPRKLPTLEKRARRVKESQALDAHRCRRAGEICPISFCPHARPGSSVA